MGNRQTSKKNNSRIAAAVKVRAAAFIPRHVSNRLTVGFLGLLRYCHRTLGRKDYNHREANEEAIRLHHLPAILRNHGYIEDQFRYRDVRLGSVDMAYAGCEIIALYNALHDYHRRSIEAEETQAPSQLISPEVSRQLGSSHGRSEDQPSSGIRSKGWTGDPAQDLSRLIADFEKDGILLSGRFGSSPRTLCHYLNQLGIRAELTVLKGKNDSLPDPAALKGGDCFILTFYNNRNNIMDMVHTICISKGKDGQFLGHNLWGSGAGSPCQDIREMLQDAQEGHAKGITLITIHY